MWRNISTLIDARCDNLCWSKLCSQDFWCILSDFNVLLKQNKKKIQHAKNWFEFAIFAEKYTVSGEEIDLSLEINMA